MNNRLSLKVAIYFTADFVCPLRCKISYEGEQKTKVTSARRKGIYEVYICCSEQKVLIETFTYFISCNGLSLPCCGLNGRLHDETFT